MAASGRACLAAIGEESISVHAFDRVAPLHEQMLVANVVSGIYVEFYHVRRVKQNPVVDKFFVSYIASVLIKGIGGVPAVIIRHDENDVFKREPAHQTPPDSVHTRNERKARSRRV